MPSSPPPLLALRPLDSSPSHGPPAHKLLFSSMASRGGTSAKRRRPTPTSPSPSPEPAQPTGVTGGGAADAASSGTTAKAGLPPFAFESNPPAPSSLPPGEVPFHDLLTLPPDPNEAARQQVEDQTLNVIDSLYQLAVCAADVQPGREDVVPSKISATIRHLAHLSASSADQDALPFVPEEVLEIVDEGRNPDAWSKNRMARLVSDNQQLAGQRWAIEVSRHEADPPHRPPSLSAIAVRHLTPTLAPPSTSPTTHASPVSATGKAFRSP